MKYKSYKLPFTYFWVFRDCQYENIFFFLLIHPNNGKLLATEEKHRILNNPLVNTNNKSL